MIKSFTYFTGIILITLLCSCNKNAESQLYVLDSLKLGNTVKDFEVQMAKKINFSQKPGRSLNKLYFVTKQFIYPSEASDYMTGSYYTTTFNDNDNSDYTDYGLIVPTYSSTNDYLLALTVIFGRTDHSVSMESLKQITNKVGEPIPYFSQTNRTAYIQKIKSLLLKKYGEPTKITKGGAVPMYAFDGIVFTGYMTDKNNTGELLQWDNDVVKITFFEGFDNYNYTFNTISDNYSIALDEDRNKTKKLDKGNEVTKSYSYLKYELSDDYVNKKKLDQPNL